MLISSHSSQSTMHFSLQLFDAAPRLPFSSTSTQAVGVALHLFDTRACLREACGAQLHVPQRAVSELLVAQLSYHQSCARLLTQVMPQVPSRTRHGYHCTCDAPATFIRITQPPWMAFV